MKRNLPFAAIVVVGMLAATYVVEAGQYSCRWAVLGYVCPAVEVPAR
ncbi:hypothetical protein BO068_005051 [Escherichia coli]|nr:hypothetical protein [Escherichia coli]